LPAILFKTERQVAVILIEGGEFLAFCLLSGSRDDEGAGFSPTLGSFRLALWVIKADQAMTTVITAKSKTLKRERYTCTFKAGDVGSIDFSWNRVYKIQTFSAD